MRTFLAALVASLLCACSHATSAGASASADAQPPAAAAQATPAQAQPAQAAPPAQSAAPGPETAAEAAAKLATQASTAVPAAAGADDAACASDDDCAFTRVGPGASDCCPMMCSPRVVSKKLAARLEARIATCHPGPNQCPVPSCMPPRQRTSPSCQAGKCVAKVLGSARDDR